MTSDDEGIGIFCILSHESWKLSFFNSGNLLRGYRSMSLCKNIDKFFRSGCMRKIGDFFVPKWEILHNLDTPDSRLISKNVRRD